MRITATRVTSLAMAGVLATGTALVAAGPAAASPRSDFLSDARDGASELWDYSDRSVWRVGKSVCRILDRGGHWDAVIYEMSDYDISDEAQAAIVVSAVYNLCPGHRYFLNVWLNS